VNFTSVPNGGKLTKSHIMKNLTDDEANKLKGGVSQCGYNIVVSASVGGLFGGAGAIVGAIAAATGPSCLAIW
jgi:hypothetical protein